MAPAMVKKAPVTRPFNSSLKAMLGTPCIANGLWLLQSVFPGGTGIYPLLGPAPTSWTLRQGRAGDWRLRVPTEIGVMGT